VGSNPRLATFLPGTQFALDIQPGTTSARKPRFRLVIIMSGSGRRTNGFASTSLCSAMKRQERNLRVPACNERNGEGFRVPEAYESLPCRNPRSASSRYGDLTISGWALVGLLAAWQPMDNSAGCSFRAQAFSLRPGLAAICVLSASWAV